MLSFQCFNISMCKIINIVENYNSSNNNKIINVNYFWFLLLICRFISTCICMRYFFDRRCNLNTKGEKHTLTHSTKESKNKNHSDDDWFDSIFNRVLFAPICFYFQFLSGINKSSSSSNRHNNNSKKVGNFWFVSNKTCAVIHPSPNCSPFFAVILTHCETSVLLHHSVIFFQTRANWQNEENVLTSGERQTGQTRLMCTQDTLPGNRKRITKQLTKL